MAQAAPGPCPLAPLQCPAPAPRHLTCDGRKEVTLCNHSPLIMRHAELQCAHRPKNSNCNTCHGLGRLRLQRQCADRGFRRGRHPAGYPLHCNGTELTPVHGYPVRVVVPGRYARKSVKWVRAVEYLTRDRRGFWEERGYHNTADPWREQRYSYQERPGEAPPL